MPKWLLNSLLHAPSDLSEKVGQFGQQKVNQKMISILQEFFLKVMRSQPPKDAGNESKWNYPKKDKTNS